MPNALETLLKGGHPNSLGRTVEVVDIVLADTTRFAELFECYTSNDETVRLRVSNAMKRVEAQRHDLLVPYINRLLTEIGDLDQASAQWTLADLFKTLASDMTADQRLAALSIMKRNLAHHSDWIVLNRTMDTLVSWARSDKALTEWLLPHLDRLAKDPRKSVSTRASKARALLQNDG